jgi:hypothetical protein
MDELTGLSRRTFMSRSAMVAGAAMLGQVPGFLARQGWLEEARAQTPDMTNDTLNGLVAFVVPGPDPYSVAQGQTTPEPGGIDAGTTLLLIETFDKYAGSSGTSGVPGAEAVATMLNQAALRVNPAAASGAFPSAFARLRFEEKVETMRQLEQDTEGSVLRAISGTLIGITAFLAYSEGGVLDRGRRETTAEPVGWKISRYDGVAEGRDELIGYWKGKRSSRTAPRYRVGKR